MEVGNVTKAATFKGFLHLSYKNLQLLFFVTVLLNISQKTNINRWFLEVTQKYELRVSFKRIIICKRSFLHFTSYNFPICFFSILEKFVSKLFDICLASIKESQNGWSIKNISSPMESLYLFLILFGELAKKQWMLINHF